MVEITVTSDAQSEVSLNGIDFASSQTFTRTDTAAQTIVVRAINDLDVEGTHTSRITAAITGAINDASYPATTYIAPVTAVITDDDTVTPPQVESVVINGGQSQRSGLQVVQVTFDRHVDITDANAAFVFTNTVTNLEVTDISVVSVVANKTQATFTFDTSDASVTSFGSLVDGTYRLTIDAGQVTSERLAIGRGCQR